MLSHAETESLLSKLCVELGFCLPPEGEAQFFNSPPDTVEAFTDAVFRAEGLNPDYADRHLYRQVRDKVEIAFQKQFDNG